MLVQVKRWLDPPNFPGDEEKTAQARSMNTLGLYFALAQIVAAIVLVPLFAQRKVAALAVILTLLLMYGISRYYMFRGQLMFARVLIVVSAWVLFVGVAIVSGGLVSPLMFAVVAITIVIGLLFERRIGYIFVVINIIFGLGLALLQQQGVALPHFFVLSPLAAWFLFALSLVFMNGATNLIVNNLEKALAHAQKMEAQLRQEITGREIIQAQLRHQSIHDGLTGIYNRTFFEEELARLEHSRKFPVSIIVVDVDDLKVVNDVQGHAVGDEILRRAASVLLAAFRTEDILARIGGDEFAVLLPQTDPAAVEQSLLRIRSKLSEHNTRYLDQPLQLSLGASTAEQGKLSEAFVVADQRMYAEKATRKPKNKRSILD